MKLFVISATILTLLVSCKHLSKQEQELRNTINTPLHLDMFETVEKGNTTIDYCDFRKQNKFISVVYLTDGCKPCYSKFMEWYNQLKNISVNDNYSVLFVIQGYNYDFFSKAIKEIEPVPELYNVIMDPYFKYVENNHIPQWIIDRSILIDSDNKIRLIGNPFATPEMTELFYSILAEK